MLKSIQWLANYSDGTAIDGRRSGFSDIDQSKLAGFGLMKVQPEARCIFMLHVEPGMVVGYDHRSGSAMRAGFAEHIVSYKRSVAGSEVHHVTVVHEPSGRVELYDGRNLKRRDFTAPIGGGFAGVKPGEEHLREQLQWCAHYQDGSMLPQYDDTGTKQHRYIDIDRSRLAGLSLVRFAQGQPRECAAVIHLDSPDQKPIIRRRVIRRLGERVLTFTLIGWQRTIGNPAGLAHSDRAPTPATTVQHIACFSETAIGLDGRMEDGACDVIPSWRQGHPLFLPVELMPQEE